MSGVLSKPGPGKSAQCAMHSGGVRCTHRSDRKMDCTFFGLPRATQNFQGGLSPAELQMWRTLSLQSAGYTAEGIAALVGTDVRICSCHYLPEQMYRDHRNKLKLLPHQRPNPKQTVQVAQEPATPHPVLRAKRRAVEELGLRDSVLAPSPPPPPNVLPSSGALSFSPAQSHAPPVPALAPAAAAAAIPPAAAIAMLQRILDEQIQQQAQAQASNEEKLVSLEHENESLRKCCVSLLEWGQRENRQRLMLEAKLSEDAALDLARREAGLPWGVRRTCVCFERLRHDEMFATNIRAMTSFWTVEELEVLFDICLAFPRGVLPVQCRPGVVNPAGSRSTKTKEEHRNYMFFVLYVLRTGANSLRLAGMLFGFEPDEASRWYATWVMVLACVLARIFPQPDEELIRATAPNKFNRMYGGRLMGIIDCTECKMQTAHNKQAQRAVQIQQHCEVSCGHIPQWRNHLCLARFPGAYL